ncbi:MAG TPA: hypothetical protein DCS67_02315, partial [Clostridiales bacterium UBA8960]|nr:hypothetical protein [Clostridiales bacterium UBA8960]
MNEQKIISSLNRTMLRAPIDILDQLKTTEVTRQLSHDAITAQIDKPRTSAGISLFRSRPALSYLSVAAVFILVISGLFYQFQARALRTILYLDVNPSIAISLNAKDKVIGLDARNDDGEIILKDLHFRGKSLEFLTLEILHRLRTEHYLENQQDVMLVSVYSANPEKANIQIERIDRLLKDALERINIEPVLIMQTMQPSGTIEQLAKNYNISESRLHFIGLLMRFNQNLVLDELVTMSLQELLAIAEDQKFDLSPILTPEVIENMTTPPTEGQTSPNITIETTDAPAPAPTIAPVQTTTQSTTQSTSEQA